MLDGAIGRSVLLEGDAPMTTRLGRLLPVAATALALAACNSPSVVTPNGAAPAGSVTPPLSDPGQSPTEPPASDDQRVYFTDVLLFAGSGTWSAEVASLESILKNAGASYRKISSSELNAMSLEEITEYGLLLFPGGSGGTQARSLTSSTHARLRQAVQEEGVSYLGFCAGAFIAVAPAPKPGQDVSYGLGVVDGEILDYYYLEYRGVTAAMTLETFADGSTRDLLWYGGPVTPEVPGGVIARHPDGTPAISQMSSGNGFVILSGPHPAAPQSIRNTFGLVDKDGLDYDLAWKLIDAALRRAPLPAF